MTLFPAAPPQAIVPGQTSLAQQVLPTPLPRAGGTNFSRLLIDGIDDVSSQLIESDKLVREFALNDSIPVHQVTFALEQARLSFELMLQVRNRLLEGYQQLMNMQL